MVDKRTNLRHLGDMSMEVKVELGRKKMKLRDVRALRKNDNIDLERLAGEAFDVRINDVLFAEGEIVVVTDIMACRLTRLVEPQVEDEGNEDDESPT
jgi:flagellar motor switch protein FliN/FliY